jgi:flagellar motor switch protein FliN/FliY
MTMDNEMNLPALDVAQDMMDTGAEPDIKSAASDLEAMFDVPVSVSAVLGKSTMEVSTLLKLSRGAVVELDRKIGEAIDIYVNNRLVARGEVVLVEDRLGVTMTEIVKSDRGQAFKEQEPPRCVFLSSEP